MAITRTYAAVEPLRADIDALAEPVVLEFGAPWYGYCIRAQLLLEAAFAQHPQLQHIKIADGPGRPLGRSFRIKLWPTLVVLRDGVELARVFRPTSVDAITQALARIGDCAA